MGGNYYFLFHIKYDWDFKGIPSLCKCGVIFDLNTQHVKRVTLCHQDTYQNITVCHY